MKSIEEFMKYKGQFLNTPLSSGKNLLELSTYRDIALWWFIDGFFQEFLISNEKKVSSTISSRTAKISLNDISRSLYRFFHIRFDFAKKYASLFLFILFRKALFKKNFNDQKKVILFTGEDIEWRPILNDYSGKIKKQDQFFSSIINLLQSKNYFLLSTYNVRFPYHKSFLIIGDKLRNWDVHHIPFEIYYNTSIYLETRQARKYFKKIWKEIDSDPIFQQILNSVGDNNTKRLRNILKYYFIEVYPHSVKQIAIAERLINDLNPSVIVIEEEYGMFERALLIAARLYLVPTVAIQHGNMSKSNPAQNHPKGEIAGNGSIKAPYYQIPDVTAVYGDFFKNLLIQECGYPDKSVVITGQPRYDALFKLKDKYDKNAFCVENSLDPERKIILIMTEKLPIFSDNLHFLESILLSVRDIPNINIIIKPHPGEPSAWYEDITKKIDMKILILPKNDFTWRLISICDLMIAFYSTTITEAIILNKPVVSVNLTGRPSPMPYHETGCVLEVTRKENICSSILRILNDKETQNSLQMNRQKFINEYCYRNDGKSTDRAVELIESMIIMR